MKEAMKLIQNKREYQGTRMKWYQCFSCKRKHALLHFSNIRHSVRCYNISMPRVPYRTIQEGHTAL